MVLPRFRLTCSISSALIFLGCTQLEDANQWFGPIGPSGGGPIGLASSGGAATAGAGSGGSRDLAADAGGGTGGVGCVDPAGRHGLGCYRCMATDIASLENACSSATCTEFDERMRLGLLGSDNELPPLPAPGAAGGTTGSANSGGAGGSATNVSAGKACADLARQGALIYVTGSSAAQPFLQQIAQQLASSRVYVVYTATGSCVGVDAIVNGTPMTSGANPAPALTATYWDSSSSPGVACDLPQKGVPADIGISDVFAQSCSGFELSDLDALGTRDAHGPIQTMTFAVPENSAYSEISARAAYFVFGFGKGGSVRDPTGSVAIWNDENYLFTRSATSGTQAMLAAAIGVPVAAWLGKPHKTSDAVAADLQAAGASQTSANLALGILAADYIDSRNLRAQIRMLAFQDSAQSCAVFPDSTSGARDKRNVRDGHYPIWGPLHLLLKVDRSGAPLNSGNRQAVTDLLGYMVGTKALPNGVKLIDVYAQSGLVPECAMGVTRSKDGGNILPYQPASPCSCVFEAKATGTTLCTPCTVQGDCAANQTCSQGYCEG
jgi:ABC-type phosphate transport system substrate-binding protein